MPFLRETSGRFSPEKIGALLIVLLPVGLLLAQAFSGGFAAPDAPGLGGAGLGAPGLGGPAAGGALGGEAALGARPLIQVIHFVGDWAVRLLLLSLAVTPARRLFNWPKLLLTRRTLGLGAAALIGMHVVVYLVDVGSLATAASEIVLRIYLTIGFVAVLAFAALSATSWDGAIRRLGAARWNRLHQLVYPATALALLHFFMQQKLDVTQPVLMTGFFVWLMGWRVLQAYGRGTGLLNLLPLAAGAGVLTALIEAGWYAAATGIGPLRVLEANLSFAYAVSPGWWVAGAGLGVALLSDIVLRLRPLPARRTARA